jgi:hypothetical protein
MPVRYLSDLELARLSSWPDEIDVADAVTYFTLSSDDLALVAGFNRVENRLGVMVQLCALSWLGWIPDDLSACPVAAQRHVFLRSRRRATPRRTPATPRDRLTNPSRSPKHPDPFRCYGDPGKEAPSRESGCLLRFHLNWLT